MSFIGRRWLRPVLVSLFAVLGLFFGFLYFTNESEHSSPDSALEIPVNSKVDEQVDAGQQVEDDTTDLPEEEPDDSEKPSLEDTPTEKTVDPDKKDQKEPVIDINQLLANPGLSLLDGSVFGVEYDATNGQGNLRVSRWADAQKNHYFKRLTADKSGASIINFSGDRRHLSENELAELLVRRIQWISDHPFEYLSQVIQMPIAPALSHIIGQAELQASDGSSMRALKKMMSARPDLRIEIKVGISEKEDSRALSRQALDSALLELYSVISPSSEVTDVESIPLDVKSALLEQMYLATQQKKIPEVGTTSSNERFQIAEQWLLENWPGNQQQLSQLQQDRLNYLKALVEKAGLDVGRIKWRLSGVENNPVSVLTIY
ncbi:hypothetical protein [Endozoicomonas ascidiicola]|uniref:hypothetical protein n=1 Tax=Endozoicomonas ascidiicola TaxID=1698521 RepID=UPI00082C766A|nr:hypothetical protein [Endozoicomonas ascidiicola]